MVLSVDILKEVGIAPVTPRTGNRADKRPQECGRKDSERQFHDCVAVGQRRDELIALAYEFCDV